MVIQPNFQWFTSRANSRSETNSLTKEQFARTRKPFDFPVLTKLPIAERTVSHDALMSQIRDEERDKIATLPREIEDFKVGDKIAISSLISLSGDKLELVKGLVVAKRRKNRVDANFTVRNVCMGVGYELTFPLYSPFLRRIRVLERGQNIRRAKLYFLRDLPKADRRNKPI